MMAMAMMMRGMTMIAARPAGARASVIAAAHALHFLIAEAVQTKKEKQIQNILVFCICILY